jgi:hypothetical protein
MHNKSGDRITVQDCPEGTNALSCEKILEGKSGAGERLKEEREI